MGHESWLAMTIFIAAYGLIISEKVHRTIAAMSGAALLVVLGVLSQGEALHYIDFNTIGLLTGMMIIVTITAQTGLFQYISIRAAQMTGGRPLALLIVFSLITAVGSAFLDNVTTVLLVVPVTLSIAKTLRLSPLPFLMSEIFMANIGGTATMIGDPPNIMIGSAVPSLSFMDFITNLAPVILVITLATIALLAWMYRRALHPTAAVPVNLTALHAGDAIKDKGLLLKAVGVLLLTIAGFFLHQTAQVETATVALAGAFLLLLLAGERHLAHAFAGVEWPTLFFFIGLFILVGGLSATGVITAMAKGALQLTGGQPVPTTFLVLWMSAIASSFIDNIPFVAAMIPLIKDMGELGVAQLEPLWWSLSLGACLGGNALLIGASANLVVVGISGRSGQRITFLSFMKAGLPVTLLSLVIATVYVWLRYLL